MTWSFFGWARPDHEWSLCSVVAHKGVWVAHSMYDTVQALNSQQGPYLHGAYSLLRNQTIIVKSHNEHDYHYPPLTELAENSTSDRSKPGIFYERERVDIKASSSHEEWSYVLITHVFKQSFYYFQSRKLKKKGQIDIRWPTVPAWGWTSSAW